MYSKKGYFASVLVVMLLMVFALTVSAEDGLVAHYAFEKNLVDASGNFAAGQPIGSRIGPTISVVTDQVGEQYGKVEYVEGVEGFAAKFDGLTGVLLPSGLIDGSTYSISLWINPEVLTQHTTTFFGAVSGNSWISIVPDGPTTQCSGLAKSGLMLLQGLQYQKTNGLILLQLLMKVMSLYTLTVKRSSIKQVFQIFLGHLQVKPYLP